MSAPLQLLLAIKKIPFTPVNSDRLSGSGTETVPAGATTCVITLIGAGGLGANAGPVTPGVGGGGGGYCKKTVTVTGGQTFNYDATTGSVTVTTGTGPSVTLVGNVGGTGASGGTGGTASGGDTNTSGANNGGPAGGYPGDPLSGTAGGVGAPGGNYGGGGGGGAPPSGSGFAGGVRIIRFAYT